MKMTRLFSHLFLVFFSISASPLLSQTPNSDHCADAIKDPQFSASNPSPKAPEKIAENRVIVLLGPAGAGKGTVAALLTEKLNVRHLSIGNILRTEIDSKSELGLRAKHYVDNGILVPADIAREVLLRYFQKSDASVGELLDGTPRKLDQVEELEEILKAANRKVDIVFEIDVSLQLSKERILGRLLCPGCQSTFHSSLRPPRQANICDHCGTTLKQRKDDNLKTIEDRWTVYLTETKPILNIFTERHLVYKIDGSQTPEKITEEILKVLSQSRRGESSN